MSEELRACPFCGSSGYAYEPNERDDRGCAVQCVRKGCGVTIFGTSTEAAIKQWNTRASDAENSALRDEVARLKRRLECDHVMGSDGQGGWKEIPRDLPESMDGIACRDETIYLLERRNYELRAKLAASDDLLDELREYFKDRQDADLDGESYVPNDEMRWYTQIDAVLCGK